jgi:hypothetical protein
LKNISLQPSIFEQDSWSAVLKELMPFIKNLSGSLEWTTTKLETSETKKEEADKVISKVEEKIWDQNTSQEVVKYQIWEKIYTKSKFDEVVRNLKTKYQELKDNKENMDSWDYAKQAIRFRVMLNKLANATPINK